MPPPSSNHHTTTTTPITVDTGWLWYLVQFLIDVNILLVVVVTLVTFGRALVRALDDTLATYAVHVQDRARITFGMNVATWYVAFGVGFYSIGCGFWQTLFALGVYALLFNHALHR